MDVGNSAGCIERDGTFLECLDLDQLGAIGLLVQAVPRVGRTLGTIGGAMIRMKMMADACGGWLRSHLMVMNRGTCYGRG